MGRCGQQTNMVQARFAKLGSLYNIEPLCVNGLLGHERLDTYRRFWERRKMERWEDVGNLLLSRLIDQGQVVNHEILLIMGGLRVCEVLKSDVVSSGFQKHLDNSRKYLGYVFNDRTVELQVSKTTPRV